MMAADEIFFRVTGYGLAIGRLATDADGMPSAAGVWILCLVKAGLTSTVGSYPSAADGRLDAYTLFSGHSSSFR